MRRKLTAHSVAPIKPKKFPFLRLPLELRDRIYYYAIHQNWDTSATLLVLSGSEPIILHREQNHLRLMLMINRQLRLEVQHAMYHHMSLCVVFARFRYLEPSGSVTHNMLKSFEHLRKWRRVDFSPSDAEVNGNFHLHCPNRDLFLKMLNAFFNFIVDNQHDLGSTTISMNLDGLHTLGDVGCTINDTRAEVHDELETFIKALPVNFLKNIHVDIDSHTVGDMAYGIKKPQLLYGPGTERLYIRIRDWCLKNRALIKSGPQWIEYWEDQGGKYEWLDYDLLQNKVTGKQRYTYYTCQDATCDDGDNCSLWK